MEITNNKLNTMPEQVQENKDNIKVLAEYIKEAYNATVVLEQLATTIDASNVRDWQAGITSGFILDQVGKLFKIVAVSDSTIYIQWWASLPQGAQGERGATGATGAKGDNGVGFNNTTDINLVVGEPLSVTYDTEDGITITSQGGIEAGGQTFTPTVENNIPLIAGNGLTMDATEDGKHVDVHLSAETQSTLARALKMPTSAVHETKLVAIDNTNAQALIGIGAGLSVENGIIISTGGTPKYLHNIRFSFTGQPSGAGTGNFYLITEDAEELNTAEKVYAKLILLGAYRGVPVSFYPSSTQSGADIRLISEIATDGQGRLTLTGSEISTTTTTINGVTVVTGLTLSNGNTSWGTSSGWTFSDIVTQI